jgi:hypothetical protein
MSEERNREVDAAWRAASSEEPPPELDAAVRAEARRAVGAGPGKARRRYRQLRYPFAAAATVALLAFGIAQLTPPDQVTPSLVSDQSATPRDRAPQPQVPAPPPTQLAENAAPAAPQPQPGFANAPSAAPELKPVPSARPQAQPAPANAVRSPESGVAVQRQPSAATDVQAKKDARRKETPAGERFAVAPSQEEPRSRGQTPSRPDTPSPVDATAKLAQSAPASETSTPPAGGVAENAPKREQVAPATAVGAVKSRSVAAAPMRATASNLDELKAKEAGVESVEAWIARIRELKARGQVDAAAKELERFRTTYGERADALLPQDLRAGAAPRP